MNNGSTQVTIVGNLTDDPEIRFTPNGVAVAKFSVAVNRRTFDRQSNEWQDGDPDFHRVTAWRGLAENIVESVSKGTRVIVVGDLRQRHWVDEKSGEKRSAWEIEAAAVGADLAFATAKVAKVAKRQAGAGPDDPWASASRQRPASATGPTEKAPF